MESKTPKFDSLLDEVFANLVPHTRICKWKGKHKYCEGEFEITNEDIIFLKKLRVPSPNFCPTCRRFKRYAHMVTLKLFKISCQAPNHNENMISIFPENTPFPVFDYKYFISDEFDPLSYGIDFDLKDDILDTLFKLRKSFPMPSFLNKDPASINSEYSNGGRDTKNIYYAGGCFHSENVWYSNLVHESIDVMDSREINKCDSVYKVIASDNLYRCIYSFFSNNCVDSMFLFDCKNCLNCFGCVGLRNKKYNIWNKQYSKEEYEKFIQEFYPITREKLNYTEKNFWDFVKQNPINASMNTATENSKGILLENSKNLFSCTLCEGSLNMRYSDGCIYHNNSMDVLFSGGKSSFLYETTNVGWQSSNLKFSVSSKFSTDSEFVFNCKNVNNCFMCFGLQNKSYCILNKQYSKEEYFKNVDDIKCKMLNDRQYGDGFDLKFCAPPYNFSLANVSYPMNTDEILNLGGYISDEPQTDYTNIEVINSMDLPKNIEIVLDDILNKAIRCRITDKLFKITSSELEFLRKMKLPLPDTHPSIRISNLYQMIKLGIYYETMCQKCNKNVLSFYDPKYGYKFYCDECYKQEVY